MDMVETEEQPGNRRTDCSVACPGGQIHWPRSATESSAAQRTQHLRTPLARAQGKYRVSHGGEGREWVLTGGAIGQGATLAPPPANRQPVEAVLLIGSGSGARPGPLLTGAVAGLYFLAADVDPGPAGRRRQPVRTRAGESLIARGSLLSCRSIAIIIATQSTHTGRTICPRIRIPGRHIVQHGVLSCFPAVDIMGYGSVPMVVMLSWSLSGQTLCQSNGFNTCADSSGQPDNSFDGP